MFPDADRVVIDRKENRHAAFGLGIHRCIGSNLARMEIKVALQEWLKRIPDFRLDPAATVTWSEGTVRGPRKLPVLFGCSVPSRGSRGTRWVPSRPLATGEREQSVARAAIESLSEGRTTPMPDAAVNRPVSPRCRSCWSAGCRGVLIAATLGLWAHYGTAVFFEIIAAGIAACF
jgi:hypothetical protein